MTLATNDLYIGKQKKKTWCKTKNEKKKKEKKKKDEVAVTGAHWLMTWHWPRHTGVTWHWPRHTGVTWHWPRRTRLTITVNVSAPCQPATCHRTLPVRPRCSSVHGQTHSRVSRLCLFVAFFSFLTRQWFSYNCALALSELIRPCIVNLLQPPTQSGSLSCTFRVCYHTPRHLIIIPFCRCVIFGGVVY